MLAIVAMMGNGLTGAARPLAADHKCCLRRFGRLLSIRLRGT
jgi:hypothetical protein